MPEVWHAAVGAKAVVPTLSRHSEV